MGNAIESCSGTSRGLLPCGDTMATRKSFGSMSKINLREHRPPGEFVLYLDHYVVPHTVSPSGACFVDLQIVAADAANQPVTPCYTVGHGFVSFSIMPHDNDMLIATLYDCDSSYRNTVRAEIPIHALRKHLVGDPGHFKLSESGDSLESSSEKEGRTAEEEQETQERGHISISFMGPGQGPQGIDRSKDTVIPQFEKEFYLIRHGESVWNQGKSANNLLKMMMQKDHPLTSEGVNQARQLNKKWRQLLPSDIPTSKEHVETSENANMTVNNSAIELEEKFRLASRVISSPMTRALQTALLACHEHTALKRAPLLLDRNLRERKKSGFSVDCTGVAVGLGEIHSRSHTALIDHCSLRDNENDSEGTMSSQTLTLQEVESIMKPRIDVNNCDTRWWTRDSDNKVDIENRFLRLWTGLKYMKERSAILVGHSNLFLDLISRFLDPDFSERNSLWAEQLRSHKMENAAVMYIKVVFPEGALGNSISVPKIVDAKMLFETKLVESSASPSDQQVREAHIEGEEASL
eukprot:g5260.t1